MSHTITSQSATGSINSTSGGTVTTFAYPSQSSTYWVRLDKDDEVVIELINTIKKSTDTALELFMLSDSSEINKKINALESKIENQEKLLKLILDKLSSKDI